MKEGRVTGGDGTPRTAKPQLAYLLLGRLHSTSRGKHELPCPAQLRLHREAVPQETRRSPSAVVTSPKVLTYESGHGPHYDSTREVTRVQVASVCKHSTAAGREGSQACDSCVCIKYLLRLFSTQCSLNSTGQL